MTLIIFLKHLKKQRVRLTTQQYKTIRGQALAGDVVGANKGLYKLLERRCE
ncbi:hypothetical protein HNQ56_004777 [Anaerotaenia torta]